MKKLILVLWVLTLFACKVKSNAEQLKEKTITQRKECPFILDTFVDDYITRYIDKEAGVVCYVIQNGPHHPDQNAGISCIPLFQTKLHGEK